MRSGVTSFFFALCKREGGGVGVNVRLIYFLYHSTPLTGRVHLGRGREGKVRVLGSGFRVQGSGLGVQRVALLLHRDLFHLVMKPSGRSGSRPVSSVHSLLHANTHPFSFSRSHKFVTLKHTNYFFLSPTKTFSRSLSRSHKVSLFLSLSLSHTHKLSLSLCLKPVSSISAFEGMCSERVSWPANRRSR